MTNATASSWASMRTEETRAVEDYLLKAGFEQVDAYRYNSASIRLRVIDPRFEGRSPVRRDAMVERHLKHLPERTQGDILMLLTIAPSETKLSSKPSRESLHYLEFEDPSPSML